MHGPSRPVKIASVSDKGHKSGMLDMYIINRLSIMTIKSETGIQKLVASAIVHPFANSTRHWRV